MPYDIDPRTSKLFEFAKKNKTISKSIRPR